MQHRLGIRRPVPSKQSVSETSEFLKRGLRGAGGEGDSSGAGRHRAGTAQGTCQPRQPAEPGAERAGLILTTAHTSPFSSPCKKKKTTPYFLQGDDDFAALLATLTAARGFSRYLGWETSKACVFPPKSTLSTISWIRTQFKLLQ